MQIHFTHVLQASSLAGSSAPDLHTICHLSQPQLRMLLPEGDAVSDSQFLLQSWRQLRFQKVTMFNRHSGVQHDLLAPHRSVPGPTSSTICPGESLAARAVRRRTSSLTTKFWPKDFLGFTFRRERVCLVRASLLRLCFAELYPLTGENAAWDG